jgi:hypothetical protein
MLSFLSVLVGAVLGLRFRVLVLVPAIGCAILASSFFSHDLAHGALASLFAVVGLQIGYLGGIVTRHVMVLARASRMRTRSQRQRTSPSLS